ncbi:MAG: hypothetical protein ACKOCX_06120 [Planctomycetota bacterium]
MRPARSPRNVHHRRLRNGGARDHAARRRAAALHPERLEPRAVLSGVPVGGQFLVSETLSPPEASVATAIVDTTSGTGGRFVAAWQSYGDDGDGFGIVARLFERDGSPVVGLDEFLVNQPLSGLVGDPALGNQIRPAVASDGAGRFVIAWQSEDRVSGGYDVWYRTGRYDAVDGLVLDAQARANTALTLGDQTAPTVAMDSSGRMVVAWQTAAADAADGFDIAAKWGSFAAGLAPGAETIVNAFRAGDQVSPAVAINAAGDVAIAWQGPDPTALVPLAEDGGEEEARGVILLQVFREDGTTLLEDTRVNAADYNDLGVPDVAFNDAGSLAVAWQVEGQQGSGSDAFARRFAYDRGPATLTPLATGPGAAADFILNETTLRPQRAPVIGIDAAGNLLAAWQTQYQDGFSWAIFGRCYDSASDTLTGEFLVNDGVTRGPQIAPDVAVAPDGRALVAWIGPDVPTDGEEGEGGHQPGVHARFFDATGATPDGDELLLATYAALEDAGAAAASDPSGTMVVVWQSWEDAGDGSDFGIYAKLFDRDGRWIDRNGNGLDDDRMLVNTLTAGSQSLPAVAMNAAGGFVVAWQTTLADGSGTAIMARRYDAAWKDWADAAEFTVSGAVAGSVDPAVAADAAGNFTVVWTGSDEDPLTSDAEGTGIFARRYSAAGVPGPEGIFRVNAEARTDQNAPVVAMNAGGEMVVAWVSDHNVLADPLDTEKTIFARWFSAAGSPLTAGDVLLSNYVKDAQEHPTVAIRPNGDFVAAWQSINQERNLEGAGTSWGVYAREFTVNRGAGTITSPQAAEFRVNETTDGPQRFPAVSTTRSGAFTVAWQSIRQDGSSWGVLARQYARGGAPLGAEAIVNSFTQGPQILPAIAQRPAGDFTVFWSGQGTGRVEGVWGQRFRFVRDAFDRGTAPTLGGDWIATTGTMAVQADTAVVTSPRALALLAGETFAQVSVEARITLSADPLTSAGVVARAVGGARPTYYWGGLQRRDGQVFALVGRQVGGVWQPLGRAAIPGGDRVRFEVIGNSLRLFVNDRLAVSAYDRGIGQQAFRVGLEGRQGSAFDDFTFAPLERATVGTRFRDFFRAAFGSPLDRAWIDRAGDFTVNGGGVAGSAVSLATINAPEVLDGSIQAKVAAPSAGMHAGVTARTDVLGDRMFWGGIVNRGGALFGEIWLIAGGRVTRLSARAIAGANPAAGHTVRLDVSGRTLRLFVDDVATVGRVTSAINAAGRFGIRASRGAVIEQVTTT